MTCPGCGKALPLPKTVGPPRKWCSHRCYMRGWTERNRPKCGCGALMSIGAKRCWDCSMKAKDVARQKRWTLIATLWAKGLTMTEIAPRVGRANFNALGVEMDRMRKAGWDLPHRRAVGHYEMVGPPLKATTGDKVQAQRRFSYAVRSGKLERPNTCERCNREGYVDGHHHDYMKPLEVEWLCHSCHMAHHAAERAAA